MLTPIENMAATVEMTAHGRKCFQIAETNDHPESVSKLPKQTTIHKRVKRHVIGREHLFFVAAPPALAGFCDRELRQLLVPENELQRRPGGFGFRGRLNDAYRINLLSRFSNRILMQVASFKATSFRRLEQKLSELPWELYLFGESPVNVRVTVRKCRLYHSSAIAARVREQVRCHLAQRNLPPAQGQRLHQVQQLFVKGGKDRFTVSIDSSGDHLYRRGIKTHGGKAPLRENLAAAVLKLAGYDGRQPLIDPMCGSGTFSLEAALISANIPPGWFREFAFMEWPSFVQRRWRYLRSQSELGFRQAGSAAILAADIDDAACAALSRTLHTNSLADWVRIVQKDFFELSPADWTVRKGVVVLNPPYGRRLSAMTEAGRLDRIFHHLSNLYGGWRLALIMPRRYFNREMPFALEIHPVLHGGLSTAVAVGTVN
jgi:putative N6-adenine-specific DNA methylase